MKKRGEFANARGLQVCDDRSSLVTRSIEQHQVSEEVQMPAGCEFVMIEVVLLLDLSNHIKLARKKDMLLKGNESGCDWLRARDGVIDRKSEC